MNRMLRHIFLTLMLLAGLSQGLSAASLPSDSSVTRKFQYFLLQGSSALLQEQRTDAYFMLRHSLTIDSCSATALGTMSHLYSLQNDIPAAVSLLQKALRLSPDNESFRNELIRMYLAQNRIKEAIALLEQASVKNPSDLNTLGMLAQLYDNQGELKKEVEVLNRIEKIQGNNPDILLRKFGVQYSMNDDKSLIPSVKKAISEYPHYYKFRLFLGMLYLDRKMMKEAGAVFEELAREDYDDPLVYSQLAQYYETIGDKSGYERTVTALMRSPEVDNALKLDYLRSAVISDEKQKSDTTRIKHYFREAIEADPSDPTMLLYYGIYLGEVKGMVKEQMECFEKVLKIDPSNRVARLNLLDYAIKKDDYKAVIRLCEPALTINPAVLEYPFYLSIAYHQDGREKDAFDLLEKTVKKIDANTDRNLAAGLYGMLGDVAYAIHQKDVAFAAYDSCLVYDPDNVGAMNNYAYYLSLEGHSLDKAEEMSYKTVKAEPHNGTYLDTYAWILFEKGKYTQARIYINEAMKDEENLSPDVVEHCGDIYAKCGDMEGAMKYWKRALEMGGKSELLKKKIETGKYVDK